MNSMPVPLSSDFFQRPTVLVARELLGHELVLWHEPAQAWHRWKIVETEAYTQDDPACHAFGRTSGRAAMLYREPGIAYVYLIYGIHHCLNVVTEPEGTAGAVLFRGLEPLTEHPGKTHGPGRLTRALGITTHQHNGLDLTCPDGGFFLAEGASVAEAQVITAPRIGISRATEYPWRFYVRGNDWVSVR